MENFLGGGGTHGFHGVSVVTNMTSKGGTVENYLPFYCHQGKGGHKKITELFFFWGGGVVR